MWIETEIIDDESWDGMGTPGAAGGGGQSVPATLPTPVIVSLAALLLAMLWVVARRALQQRAAVNADSAATEVEAARTLTDAAAHWYVPRL